MILIGEYNNFKVSKKVDFGYYLENEMEEEVLLPNGSLNNKKIEIGDKIEAFVYRDSKDRVISTLKTPLLTVGKIGYLEVVGQSAIGAFADFGLERDAFIPIKEQIFKLKTEKKYLFYMYLDKTDRIALTTKIDAYLEFAPEEKFKVSDEIEAVVYESGYNGTLKVAINKKYKGIILGNEHFEYLYPGQEVKARVKRIYEDGVIGITTRKTRLDERDLLSREILQYLRENGGFMPFNDKSSPEDIKNTFNTSKNYFKIALGGLMKQKLIAQDKEGTRLI
ncbi:S1 RNA-binding domain-containing protein [Clostridium taeniosporum]|uniref:DNA-binding protein n=1 Tax=Clostridium taeniosporum TaxID=394958 RepID=A0A1D7XLA0_9CLOT|nr:S1-like domain-containing RNA-binding protein [Clostridium taeniosporum]AOR24057.1 DNA-binding protein [Clostridium taeniosporum]